MKTLPSPQTIAHTTNQNIFKGMDNYSLARNMAQYTKTLTSDTLSDEQRTGFNHGYALCKAEFNFRNGIKQVT